MMVFNGVLGVYCTSYLVMSYGFRVHIKPDSTACQILVYGPSISTCEMKQVVVSLPSDMTGFESSQLLLCGSAFGLFPISISTLRGKQTYMVHQVVFVVSASIVTF